MWAPRVCYNLHAPLALRARLCMCAGKRQHTPGLSSLGSHASRSTPRARSCAGGRRPARQLEARRDWGKRAACVRVSGACVHACAYICSRCASNSIGPHISTCRPRRRQPSAPRRARCTCFAGGRRTLQQVTDRQRPLRSHPWPKSEQAGGEQGKARQRSPSVAPLTDVGE